MNGWVDEEGWNGLGRIGWSSSGMATPPLDNLLALVHFPGVELSSVLCVLRCAPRVVRRALCVPWHVYCVLHVVIHVTCVVVMYWGYSG